LRVLTGTQLNAQGGVVELMNKLLAMVMVIGSATMAVAQTAAPQVERPGTIEPSNVTMKVQADGPPRPLATSLYQPVVSLPNKAAIQLAQKTSN